MKATVTPLGPTRVKIDVEVPFEDLQPQLDGAYKRVGRSVKVQGFRPGKVPPRILDQRVGRGTILEEAIQDAIPHFYAEAIEQEKVSVVGRPEVELESFNDGQPLVFAATVDVRPEITVPEYDALPVTVDDVEVADADVDEQLSGMQDRFATLSTVERPVASGDFVSLDIEGRDAEGNAIDDASATGLSYHVGGGAELVPGIDAAIVGAGADESRTFDAELKYGEHAGETATFTATVRSVKEKDVPALDDDFAKTASEFDTLDEIRADLRERLGRVKRLEQGIEARDKVLEALLQRAEVPLPEAMVENEVHWRTHQLEEQLGAAGLNVEDYLARQEQTREQFDADVREAAERAVKAQLLLDAIAGKEELEVGESELTDQVIRRAQRAGVGPDEYARQVVQSGQLGALMGELLRGKALATVLAGAKVTDASGRPVDVEALREEGPGGPSAGPGAVAAPGPADISVPAT